MLLLFSPYPRSSPYSPVYFTFRSQNHCNNYSKQQTWLLQFPPFQYYKQRYNNTLPCSKLCDNGSYAFYSFLRSVPLLKSFHWLPVHYRIIFKICTMTYQTLSSTHPIYQNTMFAPARNSRQLRSFSSSPLLHSSGENESWNPSFLCCCTNSVEFAFCQC